MRAVNLQGSLDLGAGDFVAHAHHSPKHKYRHKIWLANNEGGTWKQFGYSLEDAIVYADQWSQSEIIDCYVSVNGFRWKNGADWAGRTHQDVTEIQSFYVDLDYYKLDEYKHLDPADFAALVLEENTWLPVPTMIVASGKGCWFIWGFKQPLPVNRETEKHPWLSTWQTFQDFLTGSLSKYGADPACSEAARVLRLPGTVNSKTSRLAEAWETGTRYEFNGLKRLINEQYRRQKPTRQLTPDTGPGKRWSSKGKVSSLFTWHNLAYNRMKDLQTLAHIRGGKLTEHRRMAAFYFAVSASHYCRTEQALQDEVTRYIEHCFHNPAKYLKEVNYREVVRRFNVRMGLRAEGRNPYQERLTGLLTREDDLYTLRTETIVEVLQITPAEQKRLRVLIGADEKRRRRTRKRREAGIKPRAEYQAEAQERREQAQRLHAEGLSVRCISEHMGVSKSQVHRYLS